MATYWRDNYDLSHIIARDWNSNSNSSSFSFGSQGTTRLNSGSAKSTKGLSASLRGKIHVWVGTMDAYYLDAAVYLTENRLAALDPPAEADFRYGTSHGHRSVVKVALLAGP